MGRRKYLFKDRQEAEENYREANHAQLMQLRLARALFSGTIRWATRFGAYRFGVYDETTCGGPRLVKLFHPPTGQEPDLEPIDPYSDVVSNLERMALGYSDEDSQCLVNAIESLRTMLGTRYAITIPRFQTV